MRRKNGIAVFSYLRETPLYSRRGSLLKIEILVFIRSYMVNKLSSPIFKGRQGAHALPTNRQRVTITRYPIHHHNIPKRGEGPGGRSLLVEGEVL